MPNILTGDVDYAGRTAIASRGGQQGDLIVSSLHGRYYEQALRKKVFRAATQAFVTTTVGLATTYTGLVLSNPQASTVNLELLEATVVQSVAQTAVIEAVGLAVGKHASNDVTHTTPVTPRCVLVGDTTAPAGLADVAATLPTAPEYDSFISNSLTTTQNAPGVRVDLGGLIILPPGAFVCFVTPTQASVNGMWFSFKWAENPVLA